MPTHATRSTRRLAAALLALVSAGSATAAGGRPRVWAITGATVVPAPGRKLEAATVVIRDGLIEAVGTDARVPPDAEELDGRGRWVYPALIDADSTAGLKSDTAEGSERSRGGAAASRSAETAGAVHPLSRMRPETRVRDLLLPFTGEHKRDAARLRELGFAAVLVVPQRGILRGSSAAVLVADDRPVAQLILRDGVATHAAFERGRFGEGYPTSLMGAIAALRQVLLDAQREASWSARYAAHPLGMSRPDGAPALGALAPALAKRQPVFFLAERPDDVLAADRLGREFGLDVVVSASGYEWEIAERVAATRRSLILPVAFPDKPDVDEPGAALDVPLKELRRYVEAAAGPGRLRAAGVSFALTLRGLKNTADFPKNMRKIIDAGLSADDALAALTTRPAKLLGLEATLGTLEPGKIANVAIADGPLFADKTKLRHVFVEGTDYEIEVKEKPKGDPNAVVDPRGEWSVALELGSQTLQRVWTLAGEPRHYTGTAETQSGTVTFQAVTLEGNVLTVVFPPRGGQGASEVTVIISGDTFEGTAEMGSRSAKLRGTRTAGPKGGNR